MLLNFKNHTLISLREDAHLRKAMSIIYIYAIVVHLIFLFSFRYYGAKEMEVVNYFSPFFYLASFYINRKGRIALGASIAISEAVLHGGFSLVYIGWNANFHLYIILVYLLIFFLYRLKMAIRIMLSILITIAYAYLYIYSTMYLPENILPSSFIGAAGIINIFNTAAVLSLFAISYSYFIRKNIKLLEEAENQQRILNVQKNKFFSIFSHDLKNPISSVNSLLDLLVTRYDKIDNERRRLYINQVHVAVGDTYNLVNDLLEWSRSQMDDAHIFPERIILKRIVYDIKSLFELQANSKNISIEILVGDEIIVYADLQCVYSILRNLVSNAIKFTTNGGRVLIEAKRADNMTTIKVVDTGIGISNERLDRIFSIDKQENSVGTANERGTGLGLVVVKEFVEKNAGFIKVESELNKGSIFTLNLPSTKW